MNRKLLLALLVLLAASTLYVAPVAGQEDTGSEEKEEEEKEQTGILSGLAETISEFTEGKSLAEILKDTLWLVLFEPFIKLGEALLLSVARLLTYTPSVDGNPAVQDVHRDTLIITYLLSSLGFMAAGILHMIGPVLGVTYKEVRKILPRIVVALVFATVSLPLLQLAVEFTRALTFAFEPQFFSTTFQQRIGIGTGLILAHVIQAILLVVVGVLFIVRDVYLLFVAAMSPLVALGWSLPRVKRYADTFISGWFGALMIAPLDMLVLKFSFALTSGAGNTALQGVGNWLIGIASLVLLILIPMQVWDASQSAVGMAYALAGGVKKRQAKNTSGGEEPLLTKDQKRRLRERRRKRRKDGGNGGGD